MTTIERIYRAHSGDVYRFACWLCGDATEAEDIVSETFVRLWGSLDDLRVGTVKAYVLTIARNIFLSRQRRKGRERPLSVGLVDLSPPPDLVAEKKDEAQAVMKAMQSLPDGERAAFLLRIQQELPYEEIARILGISQTAVKVRVHRARLKLTQSSLFQGEKP